MAYSCGLGEHSHGEVCLDAEGNLICEISEHTHEEACLSVSLTEEEQARVDDVIWLIESLPSAEEIEQNFEDLAASGNTEELEAYRAKILTSVQTAFDSYDALPEELRYFVTNAEKLPEYRHLLEDLPMEGADVPVISEVPNISATVTTTAALPEGAAFCLVPVAESAEATAQAAAFLEGMDSKLLGMLLLDMHFVDADGEEYQAEGETEVVLTFEEPILAGDGNVFMLHFTESGAESVAENIQRDENGVSQITFHTASFSEYGIALASEGNAISITAVNSYTSEEYGCTLFSSTTDTTIGSITSMTYEYWDAIRVEYVNGAYLVAEIYTDDVSKSDIPVSSTGFVIVVNNQAVSVAEGNTAILSGDFWRTTSAYNAGAVYGTVTFSATAKAAKDNSAKLQTVQGADTRNLIEVNLYDYGTNINDPYWVSRVYPGFQQYGGTTNDLGLDNITSYNFGDNITADLSAGYSGVTSSGTGINAVNAEDAANRPISGAMYPTLIDGYPALSDGTPLKYLFVYDSGYTNKVNSQSINGLFQYNAATGAYTFNSRENHAQFNSGSDTFTLYKQLISANYMMYPFGNFLPFNDIVKTSQQSSLMDRAYFQTLLNSAENKHDSGAGDEYEKLATALYNFIKDMDTKYGTAWTAKDGINSYFAAAGLSKTFADADLSNVYTIDYDEETNFFFGMEMKMTFMQPKGGLTGADGQQPMRFTFSGDDDVWVYVDDVLFLDLSGIHRHVGGEIDFVNGVVRYYALDTTTGDVSSTPYKTVSFADILEDDSVLNANGTFQDYSQHTFNFYYMERGAGSGVCRLNFNFPLLRQNSITVQKELSVDEPDKLDLLGNPDFTFQVLKEGGEELFIGSGVTYDILDANDDVIGTGTTDENGIFTLKAGQKAVFDGIDENAGKYFVRELLAPDAFEQYGQISINGSSETTGTGTDVTVGSDTFKGVDSPVKDVSDGSTIFHFNNEVTFAKLGKLSVTKELTTHSSVPEGTTFDFEVMLDGVLLPVGTDYTVGEQTHTVSTPGIITLAPGETAVLSGILSGSAFTVTETEASAGDFIVQYKVGDAVQSSAEATGTVGTDTTVAVTVKNSERGATLEIPITKILTNPDADTHTFTFDLVQVTDSTGNTEVPNGTVMTQTVEVGSDAGTVNFDLSYSEESLGAETSKTFYYRITESSQSPGHVRFDTSQYVVEVTVNQNTDGTMTAEIAGILKDGSAAEGITFRNTLLSDLTVSKNCTGTAPADLDFTFEVTLTGISGTFDAIRGDDVAETVTFTDGKAEIKLKHGETLTIQGIPRGTEWYVKELNSAGYQVSVNINDTGVQYSTSATGTLSKAETQVAYTNHAAPKLPATGGAGTTLYIVSGLAIMMIAWALMYITTRRRRKGAR